MATTINAYSISLGLDASSYINSANLTRSETRALSKDIDAARTPMENFVREQNRLKDALDKGAIDLGTHQRLHEKLRDQYGMTDVSVMSLAGKVAGPLAIGFGVVTTAITATTAAGVAFVSHMKETQDQIDSVADSATKLGVSYNELTGIRFAAQEAGGVDAATVDASIKKMQINIANAVNDPSSDVAAAFKRLGVTAGQLMQAGPVESMKLLADGMEGINSQADKLQLSMDIFGKSGTEMVSTLMGGRDAIEESVNFQNQWNGLTDSQVIAVQASNDAWDRIGVIIDGASTKLSAEFAPAFLVVAESVLGAAGGVNSIDEGMQMVVLTTAGFLGNMKDVAEIFLSMPGMLLGIGSESAMDLTSGQRAMDAIIAKRSELENSASEKENARKLAREKLLAEDRATTETIAQEKMIEKLSKEIDDAASERIRREEDKRREMQRKLAQDSIKAAEDHFKKERDNAKKLRDDIAKGPSSIEAGSAEAAKFMADQANAAIAASISPDQPTPTEEELLAEAVKQTAIQAATKEKTDTMADTLLKILEKKPDAKRIR